MWVPKFMFAIRHECYIFIKVKEAEI